MAVRVQLPSGWNTYLLFNTDMVNSVSKTHERQADSIALLIFVLWRYLIRRWMRDSGVGQKSYLGPTEIIYFSSKDFRPSSKHDTLWLVVSTGYFYVLFLWTIAVSDFRSLEIYKNWSRPLSTITFTVNSHADNYFYKYIYLFQILYSMKSVFLLKYMFRFFIYKSDLNVKHRYFFFDKIHGLQKKNLDGKK